MRTTLGEMEVERLDGRRLKQRIANLFWASLRSSSACGITSGRDVSRAVAEPAVFAAAGRHGHAGNEEDAFRLFRHCRSLVTPLPSQRSEMGAAGGADHPPRPPSQFRRRCTTATTRPVRGESGDQKLPPAAPSRRSLPSYNYYCSEKKEAAREKGTKKKLLSNSYGFTSSSSEDSDGGGAAAAEALFGASDETETLLSSSRSFSSDSSEFYYSSSCRCRGRKKRNSTPRLERRRRKQRVEEQGTSSTEAMGEEWRRSPSSAAAGGFAVEKESRDPREDFRSSMLEMIMERQVFGDRDLESLLVRYLSLNLPRHHAVIVEVFLEIRETLFGRR